MAAILKIGLMECELIVTVDASRPSTECPPTDQSFIPADQSTTRFIAGSRIGRTILLPAIHD
jgi:hypothetical protein